jgi:hypothetical protein
VSQYGNLSVNECSFLFRLFLSTVRFQVILLPSNPGSGSTLNQSHSLKFSTFSYRKFLVVRTFEFANLEHAESVFRQHISSVYVIKETSVCRVRSDMYCDILLSGNWHGPRHEVLKAVLTKFLSYSIWGRMCTGLRVRIPPVAWMFVSVVCCQVEVSALSCSLVQGSPTECGVSESDQESSIMRSPW